MGRVIWNRSSGLCHLQSLQCTYLHLSIHRLETPGNGPGPTDELSVFPTHNTEPWSLAEKQGQSQQKITLQTLQVMPSGTHPLHM